MKIIAILGWIALGFVLCCLCLYLLINGKSIWEDIKNFFYGLFTWQKKVPIYREVGSNQFTELLTRMFPIDHYEWQKREIPKFIKWIKTIFKKN